MAFKVKKGFEDKLVSGLLAGSYVDKFPIKSLNQLQMRDLYERFKHEGIEIDSETTNENESKKSGKSTPKPPTNTVNPTE